MVNIDLTNFELFKSFAEFDCQGLWVDLHNDFNCASVDFSNANKELILSFKPGDSSGKTVTRIEIVFQECTIQQFSLKSEDAPLDPLTIDIIYRGRFLENETLKDISDDGSSYYYVNFYPDHSLELFALKAIARVTQN